MKPHAILGLKPGASHAEIKRAYRKMAMRWHPDRNKHPNATEQFTKVRAAYEELLARKPPPDEDMPEPDPEPTPTPTPAPPHHAGPFRPEADSAESVPPKAGDIRLNLVLELEEAALGCLKTLSFVRGKACKTCQGSGQAGPSRSRFCRVCHGSGRVRDGALGLKSCVDCQGRGVFSECICPDCEGNGREMSAINLEVVVPPAMLSGDELRLAGQGEPAEDGEQAGDLYLTIVIRTHALYRRHGRDLHCVMPVSALAMIAGDDIEVPALGGAVVRHRLDPGPPETRELRFAGRGYPGRNHHLPGHLFVRLQPVYPSRLDAKQRALLQQADAALRADANAYPEITAWRKTNFGDSP